jgi:hypothetical protein
MISGSLNFIEPSWPVRSVIGSLYLCPYDRTTGRMIGNRKFFSSPQRSDPPNGNPMGVGDLYFGVKRHEGWYRRKGPSKYYSLYTSNETDTNNRS